MVKMKVIQALKHYRRHLKMNCSTNSLKKQEYVYRHFEKIFGEREIETVTEDEVIDFLMDLTKDNQQSTKNTRKQDLMAMFNFAIKSFGLKMINPCSGYLVEKFFKAQKSVPKRLPDRYKVEEMIIRVNSNMYKIIFELMGVGSMRVSEVLELKVSDVLDRSLLLRKPKSKRQNETVMIPARLHRALVDFIRDNGREEEDKIFPVSYPTVYRRVKNAAAREGITLTPHDLRRSSATYLVRRGVPIDILSRKYLRHSTIQVTERYLTEAQDDEAQRWLDVVHG